MPKESSRDRRDVDRREKVKTDRDRLVHSEIREPVLDAREKIREQRELREAREQYDKREVRDSRDVREVRDRDVELRDKREPERSSRDVKDQRIVQESRSKEPRRDAYRDQDLYIDAKDRDRERDRERDRDRDRDIDDRDKRDKKPKSQKEREEEMKRREKSRVERLVFLTLHDGMGGLEFLVVGHWTAC